MGSTEKTTRPDARRFRSQARLLALVGAIIAFGLGAAFMSIGHDPQPRDLPIAAVGGPEAARALEAKAPAELSVRFVRTSPPPAGRSASERSTARWSADLRA